MSNGLCRSSSSDSVSPFVLAAQTYHPGAFARLNCHSTMIPDKNLSTSSLCISTLIALMAALNVLLLSDTNFLGSPR